MKDDVSELVAQLQPGDAEADFPESLLHRKRWHYTWDGRWRVSLDKSDRVESVTYWAGFPPTLPISGLWIGMNSDELVALVPGLQTLAAFHETDQAFLQFSGVEAGIRRAYVKGGRLRVLESASERAKATPFLRFMDTKIAHLRAQARPVSADPDVLLGYWVEDARNLTFDRSVLPRFANWLRTASSDRWHQMARQWNWDNGTVPLFWIVHQSNCDLATAVLIHQYAEPGYYRQFGGDRSRVPSHAQSNFDLLLAIRQRIATGSYLRCELDIEEGLEDLGTGDGLTIAPRAGRKLPLGEFDEGIPIELYLAQ